MIINDSDKNWEIVRDDGITITIKPNEGYEPSTQEKLTIVKPS